MDVVGKHTLEVMHAAGWYNRWLFALMEPYLKGEILEIGSGLGNFTKYLTKNGNVTATDIDETYLDILKNKKDLNFKVGYGNIETGKFKLSGKKTVKKYDAIVCLNVLEHIKNDNKALKNVHDLLKPGGKFILLVPAHMTLYSNFDDNLGHFRRYTSEEVGEKFKKAGLEVMQNHYLNWFAAIGWLLFIKVGRVKRMPLDKVRIFNSVGRMLLFPEKYISPPFGLSVFAVGKRT